MEAFPHAKVGCSTQPLSYKKFQQRVSWDRPIGEIGRVTDTIGEIAAYSKIIPQNIFIGLAPDFFLWLKVMFKMGAMI